MKKEPFAKDWELMEKLGIPTDPNKDIVDKLMRPRYKEIGCLHQPFLYTLACRVAADAHAADRAPVIIETGVRTGISTVYLLHALQGMLGNGKLFSCDPVYNSREAAMARIVEATSVKKELFEGWTFFGMKSQHALPLIFEKEPLWDLFIHDSDHSPACMTYEMEYAWDRLRPGGILVVDDYDGDLTMAKHDAFFRFAEAKGLEFGALSAHTVLVVKPGTPTTKKVITLSEEKREALSELVDETEKLGLYEENTDEKWVPEDGKDGGGSNGESEEK